MGEFYQETGRAIPVAGQFDVVVAGGGPAGMAAAIAAGRGGASVLLLEQHGCLGGIWTSGLLAWMLDTANKGGLMSELFARLEAVDGISHSYGDGGGGNAIEVETLKFVLEQMCGEAGVRIRYHTRVAAAAVEAGRLALVVTESKSGRQAWRAKAFVDCTGDGDLAAQAGCRFAFGRPAEGAGSEGPERAGETQPFSLIALVGGLDPRQTAVFHDRSDGRPWSVPKDALQAEFQKFGRRSSYGKPTIFHVHDQLFIWMINHEYGCSGLDADQVTAATLHARRELNELVAGLRTLGGCWRNVRLVATAEQIGIREGRRIQGRHLVTVDEMLAGARFADGICRVTFGIDVHSTNKAKGTAIESSQSIGRTQPYDIPLRALIAADCDGLLLAGRCISGDFLAHSSYRVTGNAVAMGQAAGACAAAAARTGRLPHQVPFAEIAGQCVALPASEVIPCPR